MPERFINKGNKKKMKSFFKENFHKKSFLCNTTVIKYGFLHVTFLKTGPFLEQGQPLFLGHLYVSMCEASVLTL